eukprot:TRINITY_DN2346_c0_g1_i1.p1 TRINITY_DN2346_c0_g1~~TRINITY_DN2346_c0_g1_i1.p1  ORF type:complete len:319 (-),score=48.12 TRINITY_DN2346_c0_g1_i1:611-1474(-)
MATSCLTPSPAAFPNKIRNFPSSIFFPSSLACFLASSLSHANHSVSFVLGSSGKRVSRILAVVEDESSTAVAEPKKAVTDGDTITKGASSGERKAGLRSYELYVCNLPRSCDIAELLELFNPYGTVQSVEVSRDIKTGISRGCGYVTMSSFSEAKAVIAALDGSDLGGREMRIKFSSDMTSKRKNTASNKPRKKNTIFESPHRVYVGNLAWSVKPEDLKEHFSQFGTVVSTRLMFDRKPGRNRVYGFLSFSSAAEQEAAVSSSGTEFHGRTILVRELFKGTSNDVVQ